MTDDNATPGPDDVFHDLLDSIDDDMLPPADEITPITDESVRRGALEAAVTADGFREIKAYCGEEYDATFDSNRSTVLDLSGPGSLSTLVSFQARVPNSPFDEQFSEAGLTVLFEDGTPAKVVGLHETSVDGTLEESTVITYEDGKVVVQQVTHDQ